MALSAGCSELRRDHYPDHPALPLSGSFELVPGLLGTQPRMLALGRCDDDDLLDVAEVGGDDSAPWQTATRGPPAMHLGSAAGFVASDALAGLADPFATGLFSDLDGDGHEDLVLASDVVVVLRNRGGCRFADPVRAGEHSDRGAVQVLVTDADLDGLADLAVATRGFTTNPYRLLVARGDGTYEESSVAAAPLVLPAEGLRPFSMFHDDVDDDGRMDLFAMIDLRSSWFSWGTAAGAGHYARDDGLSSVFSQADPMSVNPLDFDRDGRMDYFVTGVPGHSLLLRGSGGRSLVDVAYDAEIEGVDLTTAWGSWAFDADFDGWSDLLMLRLGNDDSALAGPTQLYVNRGDGTFAEVGAAHIGASVRGKTLVCGDLTGHADLGCFALTDHGPLLLRDHLVPRGSWAGLRLVGTVSAPPAVGARVAVLGGTRPQVLYYGPQSPNAGAHANGLVVGLGARTTADVEVTWPSGLRQRVTNLASGRYTTVTEPAAVTLSARTARSDGRSTVEVVVDPLAAGATLAGLGLEGDGALADGGDLSGGRHRWIVTAPATPGAAALTVLLDGAALKVRPRVRFLAMP